MAWSDEGKLKEMGVTKLTVGLIIGTVVGATLGTIFAPKAGKDTRNLVKNKPAEVVGTIRGRLHQRQKTLIP